MTRFPKSSALIASPLDNDKLLAHPVIQLLLSHGTRGWEEFSLVTGDEKLVLVLAALEGVGIRCLVMGGHACRVLLRRESHDGRFLTCPVAPDCWDDLALRMTRSEWIQSQDPREIGKLAHLDVSSLSNGHPAQRSRRIAGVLERESPIGAVERNSIRGVNQAAWRTQHRFSLAPRLDPLEGNRAGEDWLDIQSLEEFHDARLAASVRSEQIPLAVGLSQLQSGRGLETHLLADNLRRTDAVTEAIRLASNPITVALLLPATPDAQFFRLSQ